MIPDLLLRSVRNLLTVIVYWIEQRGWLPVGSEDNLIEGGAIALAFAVQMAWSVYDDRRKERARLAAGQSSGAVGSGGAGGAGGA